MADQKKYSNKLAGARCLVIGGTSGIGFAVAEALVEFDAIVMVSSSNPKRVDEAVSRLQTAYPSRKGNVTGHVCDLGDEATIEGNIKALLEATTDKGARKLDHVVHTAGQLPRGFGAGEADLSIAYITQNALVRYYAVLLMNKHIAAYLAPGPATSWTFTTGSISERPFPGMPASVGQATALHGVARALALDLKPVRVNVVCPGAVKTELWDSLAPEVYNTVAKDWETKVPTGRVGTAEDVAEAYLYAMRDHNFTGKVISTDSGHLLIG